MCGSGRRRRAGRVGGGAGARAGRRSGPRRVRGRRARSAEDGPRHAPVPAGVEWHRGRTGPPPDPGEWAGRAAGGPTLGRQEDAPTAAETGGPCRGRVSAFSQGDRGAAEA